MDNFQRSTDKYLVTIEKGKKILSETRSKIYKIPAEYEHLLWYVGEGKTLRTDILSILTYLLNPHNKQNEAGEIEQRFFTAYHKYCFYLDANALVAKGFNYKKGRGRANQGMNLLCALGFFEKDKEPWKYGVNLNAKLNTEQPRYMNIYHFKSVDLKVLDENARRLRNAKIFVSNISRASLRAAGLNDIAEEVYFRNDVDIMSKKMAQYRQIVEALISLLDQQEFCTKGELLNRVNMKPKKAAEILRMFKIELEKDFHYGVATNAERAKFNYTGRKWIYRRRGE